MEQKKPKLYLHAVIVDKSAGIAEANKIARKITERKRTPVARETEESYRYKNIPKNFFIPSSFRSKKINETTTLVFGHLKPERRPKGDE